MTDEVSVRELKTRLSDYLRRVREGEGLVVTSRRRPLARLTPLPQPSTDELAWVGPLQDVHWTGGKPKGGRRRPVIPGKTAAERVLEDRRCPPPRHVRPHQGVSLRGGYRLRARRHAQGAWRSALCLRCPIKGQPAWSGHR